MVDGRTDGRTTDGRRLDGYTISSPCEPNGSGELTRLVSAERKGSSIRHIWVNVEKLGNAKQVAQRATIAHLRANFTFSYCKSTGDDDPLGHG